MIGIIYKYVSPCGKVYIGQTIYEARRRKTFFNLNKSYGGDKIDSARKKYGPENFTYEILFKSDFKTAKEAQIKLDEMEAYYIDLYDSYRNGYNMTLGGYTTTGMKLSDDTKQLLSKIRTGKTLRPRTLEEKEYHSKVMKQKWTSKEYREIRENINNSEEHKRKVSESLKGEKNGMFGKTHSEEAKRQMSISRTGEKNIWYGKQKSEGYRAKIKSTLTDYYQNHEVSEDTRKLISEKISTPVEQYSMDGVFIASYKSTNEAGRIVGIDASCIVKVCKGKRKSAGGYHWRYARVENQIISWEEAMNDDNWLGISEVVAKTGRNRNVIYYHIKKHGVPVVVNGRRRLIYFPAILEILKDVD